LIATMRFLRLGAAGLVFCCGSALGGSSRARGAIALPPLDPSVLKELSQQAISTNKGPLQIGVGRIFDDPVVVGEEGISSNEWLKLYDGSSSWSVALSSEGALGLRLHLQALRLPAPVQLIVYNPADPERQKVAMTGAELGGARDWWTETIFSDQLVLECRVPAGIDPAQVHFEVAELSHLYRMPIPSGAKGLKEGGCYNDVSCFSDWAEAASSVARFTYVAGRNTYLCTGCLLASANGTNRADYFLAARHCITGQTLASTMEFYWLFQTSSCNAPPPDLATVPHTTGGGLILAAGVPSDFCFLRLRRPAPDGVGRANWTAQLASPGDAVACIHHPDGTFKRISFGNLLGSDPYFLAVQWSSGATESVSSGAPLFNGNQQIIGHLTGGYNGPGSSCDSPTAPDEFARFDITYTKIRRWLGGSGGTGTGLVPRGTYSGLLYDQNGGAHLWNSGFLMLTTATNGLFTGSLMANGRRRSFHGQFDGDLHAQIVLSQGKQAAWTMQLQLAPDDPNLLNGSVSDGNWTVQLAGNLAFRGSRTNAAPQVGHYNVVFPGNPVAGLTPGGDSFGTVTVDRSGRVHLIASLADGSKITQATSISANGDWPFFASLSSGHSMLLGWFNFSGSDSSDINGNLTWVKSRDDSTGSYTNGFEMNEPIVASRYVPPARGETILKFTLASVSLAGGGVEQPFSVPITMKKGSRVSAVDGNDFALGFSVGRGTFSGHAIDPTSSQEISFSGVVLQKQNSGSGFFTWTNQTGQVVIQPSS
jgi:lysyl endopeptidase